RQGLTPPLLARLTRFAEWQTIGLACTLRLTADSVYRGLESGETLNDIVRLLERHGTRAISETVLGSLRSWASKRERVLGYAAALSHDAGDARRGTGSGVGREGAQHLVSPPLRRRAVGDRETSARGQ